MKRNKILSVAIVVLMLCFGCEKSNDEPSVDYATNAAGVYTGTWVIVGSGQIFGTCKVVKKSGTSVDLETTAGGAVIPTIPGVKLSDGGNGKVKLTYKDPRGTLNGTIENNLITFTLIAGSLEETFTGTK